MSQFVKVKVRPSGLGQVVSWFVRGKVRPGGLGQVVSWFLRVKVRPVHGVRWCHGL